MQERLNIQLNPNLVYDSVDARSAEHFALEGPLPHRELLEDIVEGAPLNRSTIRIAEMREPSTFDVQAARKHNN